ncbi:MAG: stage III sporulation protein AE [Oscillospiraceae bacterium]|jgi:stage III sporulation protein AE|nr:stage III sporulation protein AE [Oscillospiraceae bacterium]
MRERYIAAARRVLVTALVLAAFLVLPQAFSQTARASGESGALDRVIEEQSGAVGAGDVENAVGDEARELLGGLKVGDAAKNSGAFGRLLSEAAARIRGIVTASVRNAAVIVLAAIFSGLFASCLPGNHSNYAILAAILVISAVSLASVNTFIGMGSRVLDDLQTFSRVLLPCLTAAAAASGAVTSASVKYAATTLFLDIMQTAMRALIMPLIYAYCAVSVGEAAIGGTSLAGVSSLLKWLVKTVLSAFVIVFIIYMSVAGVVASSSDAAALRAAKVTIATVLPVVGSIAADAADTILSGASVLRGAIGVFGVLAVAATCAVPFLKLGINYLLFKLAGGLSGTVADARITKLAGAFADAFGMTLAMSGVCAIMLFVSIISVIRFTV